MFSSKQLDTIYRIIWSKREDIDVAAEYAVNDILEDIACERDRAELIEFKEYLSDELRASTASEFNLGVFQDTEWHIDFGKRGIVVPNNTSLYTAITDWLEEYIDDLC